MKSIKRHEQVEENIGNEKMGVGMARPTAKSNETRYRNVYDVLAI